MQDIRHKYEEKLPRGLPLAVNTETANDTRESGGLSAGLLGRPFDETFGETHLALAQRLQEINMDHRGFQDREEYHNAIAQLVRRKKN